MGSNDGLDCRETNDSIEGRGQVKSGTSPSLSFAAMRSGISGQWATRREKISCSMVVSIEALQVPPRTGKCLWDLRICSTPSLVNYDTSAGCVRCSRSNAPGINVPIMHGVS